MESVEAQVTTMKDTISKAFYKFKIAYTGAIQADARLEYFDQGYNSAKKAWEKADQAETEFKSLLDSLT